MRPRLAALTGGSFAARTPLPSRLLVSALVIATCAVGAVVGLFLGDPTRTDAQRAAAWVRAHHCGGRWYQTAVADASGTATPIAPGSELSLTFDTPAPGDLGVFVGANGYAMEYRLANAPHGDPLRVEGISTGLVGNAQTDAVAKDEALIGSIDDAHPAGMSCTAGRVQLDTAGAGRLVYARRAAG